MSPEQAAGEADLDGRSDLYSLACVLYEMLAGQPPFTGPTAANVVHQHLTVDARPVSQLRPAVPPAIADVLARALAKTPADRFSPAAQFAAALGPLASAAAPAPRGPSRLVIGIGAAAVLVAVAVTAIVMRKSGDAPAVTIGPHDAGDPRRRARGGSRALPRRQVDRLCRRAHQRDADLRAPGEWRPTAGPDQRHDRQLPLAPWSPDGLADRLPVQRRSLRGPGPGWPPAPPHPDRTGRLRPDHRHGDAHHRLRLVAGRRPDRIHHRCQHQPSNPSDADGRGTRRPGRSRRVLRPRLVTRRPDHRALGRECRLRVRDRLLRQFRGLGHLAGPAGWIPGDRIDPGSMPSTCRRSGPAMGANSSGCPTATAPAMSISSRCETASHPMARRGG